MSTIDLKTQQAQLMSRNGFLRVDQVAKILEISESMVHVLTSEEILLYSQRRKYCSKKIFISSVLDQIKIYFKEEPV